jgi:hypothetical protein
MTMMTGILHLPKPGSATKTQRLNAFHPTQIQDHPDPVDGGRFMPATGD